MYYTLYYDLGEHFRSLDYWSERTGDRVILLPMVGAFSLTPQTVMNNMLYQGVRGGSEHATKMGPPGYPCSTQPYK